MAKGPGGQEVGRVSIRVVPDMSGFRAELRRELRAIQNSMELEIQVTADTTRAILQLKALDKIMSRIAKRTNISANVNTTGVGVGNLSAQADALDRMSRSSRDLERNSRQSNSNFTRLSRTLIGGVLSPIVAINRQLITMNRIRAIVIGVIVAIPAVLGPVAGLLAGIPSLLLAFGAAAAAVAVGMDGIKSAFSGLSDEAKSLKSAVSSTFEATLTPQAEKLEKVFPVLERGLSFVAQGLSDFFGGFVDAVTATRGMENLNIILARTGNLFDDMVPGMYDLTAGFLQMGRIGAENFDLLAETFNDFAEGFREIVDQTSDATWRKMFEGLAGLTDGLLDGLLILFRAGVDMLGAIGEPLGDLLRNFSVMINNLVPTLSAITYSVINVFDALLPIFEDVLRALGPGIIAVFNALAYALQIAAPGLEAIAAGFSDFLRGIAPAIPAIGEMANTLGPILGDALRDLGPVVRDVLVTLTQALSAALPAIIPAVVALASGFSDILAAIGPLVAPIAALAGILISGIAQAFKIIAPIVEKVANSLSGALGPVIPKIADGFERLVDAIGPIAGPLAEGLTNFLRALIPLLPKVIDLVTVLSTPLRVIAWALSGIITLAAGLLKFIDMLIEGIGRAFGSIFKFGTQIIDTVAGVDTSVHGSIKMQEGLWERFGTTVQSATEQATSSIQNMATETLTPFQQMLRSRQNDTVAWNRWVLDQNKAQTQATSNTRKNISDIIYILTDGKVRVGRVGTATGRAYADGLRMGEAAAKTRAAVTFQGVINIFNGGKTRAIRAGAETARGFAQGMADKAAIAAAAQAAARLVEAVSRFFPRSPAKEGAFSGTGWTLYRGQALAEGFADGILSRISLVENATDKMMGAASSAASIDIVATSSATEARKPYVVPKYQQRYARAESGELSALLEAIRNMRLEIDPLGVAKAVNQANRKAERR